MSNGLQEAYSELKEFIAEHPEVEIGVSIVKIPENVRPEFYRLFDTTRTAFLEEKFPALLGEVEILSENYTAVKQEVIELLELDSITTPDYHHRFLHNPKDRLARELFDLLFDLLKEKIDFETFEQKTSRNIEATFRDLYRPGYEKWVALSMVKLLEADKTFNVTPPRPKLFELDDDDNIPIGRREAVRPPQEAMNLSFGYERFNSFIVPDFIVHSTKINQYVAIRTELGNAFSTAENASEEREWYPLNSIRLGRGSAAALKPGLLIYVDDKTEDIAIIADKDRICRPDLIIECREQKDWYEREGLKNVELQREAFKPRLGTYVVSREPVPEQAYKELVPEEVCKESALEQEQKLTQEPEKHGAKVCILTVGFDQSKLAPIIDALMSYIGDD